MEGQKNCTNSENNILDSTENLIWPVYYDY